MWQPFLKHRGAVPLACTCRRSVRRYLQGTAVYLLAFYTDIRLLFILNAMRQY